MKIITETYVNEYVIEKSKFISIVLPIEDASKVKDCLKNIKEKYPKATHYCYAYNINGVNHSSDDGEPSGTAGVPILKVLQASGLDNVILIVVRYFGGIKLGAGGLLRAYSTSASQVLKNAVIRQKKTYSCYKTSIDYGLEQQFSRFIADLGGIIDKQYNEKVEISFYLKDDKSLEILNDKFLGKLEFINSGKKEIIE